MDVVSVLFASASPDHQSFLRSDRELRAISEECERSPGPGAFKFNWVPAASDESLRRTILRTSPDILHLSSHGTKDAVVLEDGSGGAIELTGGALAGLLASAPNLKLVILNACYSEAQARALLSRVPAVVGMSRRIRDAVAIKFVMNLYMALAHGASVRDAFAAGVNAIECGQMPGQDVPVLLPDGAPHLGELCLVRRAGSPPGVRTLGQLQPPASVSVFVGRGSVISELQRAWESGVSILQLVGDGGVGKSTVVWHWLQELQRAGYSGVSQALDWSFYNQESHEYTTDSQRFLETAVRHFRAAGEGFSDTDLRDAQLTGSAVADALVRCGGLMILDGFEPLQAPPSEGGGVRDGGLAAFLRQLRMAPRPGPGAPRRLLVITTRWDIEGLAGDGVRTIRLENLDPADGAELLRRFRLRDQLQLALGVPLAGPEGERQEFESAAREVSGHALSLVLLASFLLRYHRGDLRRRADIDPVTVPDPSDAYRHARRLMATYDRLFGQDDSSPLSAACRQVLRVLGLFPGPAPLALVDRLQTSLRAPGLTDRLHGETLYQAVAELRRLRILSAQSEWGTDELQCHPVIREFCRGTLEQPSLQEHAAAAHSWLYDYFRDTSPEAPQSLRQAAPILEAVRHGCRAGRYREAFELYWRTLAPEGGNSGPLPGAQGPLLAALAGFFDAGTWSTLRAAVTGGPAALSDQDQGRLLQQAVLLLTVAKGYGTREVEAALQTLVRRMGAANSTAAFRAVYSDWNLSLAKGELGAALTAGRRLLGSAPAGAGAAADPALEIAACSATGAAQMYLGELRHAADVLDRGYRLVPRSHGGWSRVLFAQDPPVACGGYLAWTEALRGRLDRALEVSGDNVAYARRLGHPFSLACALHFASIVRRIRREPSESLSCAREQIRISQAHSFPLWLAAGVANEGYALIEQEDLGRGLVCLAEGVRQWERAVPGLVRSHWRALLADARLRLARSGRDPAAAGQAQADLQAGLDWAEQSGERYFLAELQRLQGVLAELRDQPQEAAACYAQAAETAAGQGAHLFVLRATVAAARLGHSCNPARSPAQELGRAIENVGQGLGCPDCVEARALRGALPAGPAATPGPGGLQ